MEVAVAPRLWAMIPVFVLCTCVFKTGVVFAGVLVLLLPATKFEVSISWQRAAVAALVLAVLQQAADKPDAGFIGCLVKDIGRSRLGTLAYSLFGGVALLVEEAAPLPPMEPSMPRFVRVVRTAKSTGERFAALPPLQLQSGMPGGPGGKQQLVFASDPAVVLDETVQYQTFLGFGGSFTETSAELLLEMAAEKQEQILRAYFDEESGLGYTLGRLHMGSCDFSRGNWSCVEVPGDVELESFSIARYEQAILPMLRRARATAGRPLLLMASPWSPPYWMKDHGSMMKGGKLRPEYRTAWAKYYVKFAEAFKEAGMPLWALSVQNEPHAQTPWENCFYTHEEERDFVRDHLGPALNASGLDLKLLIWDHNRDDMLLRAKAIFDDPEAEKYVWGVAYHWYGDNRYEMWPAREGQLLFDNLRRVHELRPDKHIVMSESCQENGPRIGDWRMGERYGEAIIRDLNNWLEAWIDWNLILDPAGGPNHVYNYVSAPVIADARRGRVLFLSSYYYIGHFSRYIRPGARRILAGSNRDALETVAFQNPDGSLVLVVMNQGDYDIGFYLQHGSEGAKSEAPARSISTFVLAASSVGR